jgi:DNA-binding response OmpR family regulator
VAVVPWPEDAELLEWLAESATARLVLARGDEPVPWLDDPLQDWVRMPVHLGEAQARLEALARKVADRRRLATVPQLDENGRLFHGGLWVPLSGVTARLAGALVEAFGQVVEDTELLTRGWPEGGGQRDTLRVQLTRLRRRIKPLGLGILYVNGGHVLSDLSQMPPSRWRDPGDPSPGYGR